MNLLSESIELRTYETMKNIIIEGKNQEYSIHLQKNVFWNHMYVYYYFL